MSGLARYPVLARNSEFLSLLQNFLKDMEKRQGTTSVVPNRAIYNSGFSRCGIVNS
jgi:hypothetical protein